MILMPIDEARGEVVSEDRGRCGGDQGPHQALNRIKYKSSVIHNALGGFY